jgi:DNA replication and repair protein RecF
MRIESLFIKTFRNYDSLSLPFSSGKNFIIGDNGSGKTNILEAIFIVSNIKSFRGIRDFDLVKWGCNGYFCRLEISDYDNKRFEIGCQFNNGKAQKKLKIDDQEFKKYSEYFGRLFSVILCPDDMHIIDGYPESRRTFFDRVLSKIDNVYFITLQRFNRLLYERNVLLKQIKEKTQQQNTLDVWDYMISESMEYLLASRKKLIDYFSDVFSECYSLIDMPIDRISIRYQQNIDLIVRDDILDMLKKYRLKDILTGRTNIGPHKDDFIIEYHSGKKFNAYASQGQKRTAAVSLKLSEIKTYEKFKGVKSIILIDDVFSELDNRHIENLLSHLDPDHQVIMTLTGLNGISLSHSDRILKIKNSSFITET